MSLYTGRKARAEALEFWKEKVKETCKRMAKHAADKSIPLPARRTAQEIEDMGYDMLRNWRGNL